ncbi:MAG: PLDc_N domain-containing protein [Cyclobacteriaceae bacterium]|nr:PLDc_N domain-containing protein [Cyclobacteriaceae bacterium]
MILAISMPGSFEWIIILVAFSLTLILPILAISDVMYGRFNPIDKLKWIVLILFLPVVGSMIYFWFGREQKIGA